MMNQPDQQASDSTQLRSFSRYLLRDLRALEYMLDEGLIESATRRIGAEQELFMVDEAWQPAPLVTEVMERVEDPRVTTELTRFNLEFNLPPMVFEGDCLRKMEQSLTELIDSTRQIVQDLGGDLILTGILPTIRLADLDLDNMTPMPRYRLLNDRLTRLRGGPYEFQIRGIDELLIKHDSVMLEGCNTSFQAHFQVDPEDFAHYYNIAQVATAPILAAGTNSPLLFGKRLWRETRIALFQQAIDTRSSNLYMREMSPRVNFGTRWVEESVLEIFQEDISRFQIIMSQEGVEDPFEQLDRGEIPGLDALQIHNGTVYRWNRPCYGVHDGKPHLRIENRVLPSGPTAADEFANAAFWFGLVSAMARKYPDVPDVMDFSDAKANFMAAARHGLASQFKWMDGKRVPASDLICDRLLPLARTGLDRADIAAEDIDRYLGIIRERIETGQTGSQWQLDSLHALNHDRTVSERLNALTAATVHRQHDGGPVHTWALAEPREAGEGVRSFTRVEQCMTTDLFTVNENELVEFVAHLMDWQRIQHVPVEDNEHRLVGIVSHRRLLDYLVDQAGSQPGDDTTTVGDIMVKEPISVAPDTSTLEAVRLMRERQIGALPVVQDGHLVGIVTETDFMQIAEQLMEQLIEGQEE